MTDITDAEAAEVLWASSEQGNAASVALIQRAEQLGIAVKLAEAGALTWAAHKAAGLDAEPMEDERPAHDHQWAILGVQPHTMPVLWGKPAPYAIVLIRCSECGEPDTRTLPGEWTLEDLSKTEGRP